jgi:hypothetical protein
MIKRLIILVVTSSVISAGLLYLGITMMGQFSPALASSLNALVAGTNVQNSPKAIPAEDSVPLPVALRGEGKIAGDSVPLTVALRSGNVKQKISSNSKSVPVSPVGSDQTLKVSANSIPAQTPVTGVTISQLLNNPKQFINHEFTLTGIATSLSNGKFLLNDGTGQILMEFDDDLVSKTDLGGQSINVSGKLDYSSSQSGIYLEVHTFTDQNGTVVTDDCPDDDSSDDCSDNSIDDDCLTDDCSDDDCLTDDCSDDDCLTDDCSDDDCLTDDCSDDSGDDDSNDDSSDDSSDDSNDDDSGDDDSGDDGEDD